MRTCRHGSNAGWRDRLYSVACEFLRGLHGVVSENGIYGHSRFCNTDFDDKLACLNLSGV
ncbi:hypothetical protein [Pseudomonas aeruginosa]|uniref:hypothetical protein n=1 Tax=Pseudomonas aeruginosa TaxID=287 RepID=UPI003969EC06